MADQDHVVALGLLTRRDLAVLGEGFTRAFPITDVPCFGELLHAIDEADRAMRRDRQARPDCDAGTGGVARTGRRVIS